MNFKSLAVFGMCGLVLAGCGVENEDATPEEESQEVKMELNDKVGFADFTIEMDEAQVYEEDGKQLIDIELTWTNDSFPEEKSFLAAVAMDVTQGEELLTEVGGEPADPKSNYYYKAKPTIWTPINLTYELVNDEDSVNVLFIPLNEYEENKEYVIDINK